MRRRDFLTFLGSTATAWPLVARAQQPTLPVIGYLSGRSRGVASDELAVFHRGLGETGYVEGRNVAIEYRWLDGHYDRIEAAIADLIQHRVAVIVTPNTTASALAARAATRSIPIVFVVGSDPVAVGLVASLNRPGGNATGVTVLQTAAAAKRLELLHELVPAATSIGFLVNPNNPRFAEAETKEVQAAARLLGVRLLTVNASSPSEIEMAFERLLAQRVPALQVGGDILFSSQSDQFAELGMRSAIPTIYAYLETAQAGGLVSYGSYLSDALHIIGAYTGRILRGEEPATLPVQQVTKVELVINLKTARAIGVTFPLTLLGRADEVIE
jgi:putative ABC transport system substrate-binding protein